MRTTIRSLVLAVVVGGVISVALVGGVNTVSSRIDENVLLASAGGATGHPQCTGTTNMQLA